jgi:hypothetical protein
MERRTFVNALGLTALAAPLLSHKSLYKKPNSFFTIKKVNERYFLIDPDGQKFFSTGINHIDSSPLRYIENNPIWENKYDNSMEKWLKTDVRVNLKSWGFNTLGWNQEVVTRNLKNTRHSRSFTPEEYTWLNMPYCHMLHFADFHQWEAETIHPDFFSKDFSDWCDFVARDEASRLANDPNLIGYFYIDCPTWIHTTENTKWKGPLFDPEKLKSEAGKKELFDMATQYYKVTNEAIRRYDKNHLILGDRYEAGRPIAEEVINAALPYVDVLCFQHFATPEKIVANLNHWNEITGKPTLSADCSHQLRDQNTGYAYHTLDGYPEIYRLIKETPSCIGYHLCGAYLENRVRKRGLLKEDEKPNIEVIDMMKRVNQEMEQWVKNQS